MADPTIGNRRRLAAFASFPADFQRNEGKMQSALEGLILSTSGWRKIFAASEQDTTPEIDETHREIVAAAAQVYAEFLDRKVGGAQRVVALGTDSRPTGQAIASVLARVLLATGVEVRYLGITAAPEIMAYVRKSKLQGFVYVSASHNPIGHNGLKFGLADGGVLGGTDAQALIASFNSLIQDAPECSRIAGLARSVADSALETLDKESVSWKRRALETYLDFALEVGTMETDTTKRETLLEMIRSEARRRRLGILADFNGSARTLSIDRTFIEGLGVRFEAINELPGQIVHTIVPEGPALEPCRSKLEELHTQDAGVLLGYVPDNDGDRGNVVLLDPASGKADILRAQEVFALSCMAELAYLVYTDELTYSESGKAQQRHAVVVNGPTSLRVDAIAKAFDVRVFRSEVGEANVVNLARDSRGSGFKVRMMGEGSNGGNITYPSSVRDPLNTIFAFLKLLLLPSLPGKPGLYEIWCRRSGREFNPDAGLLEMVASLPDFVTTDVNEPRAIVDIKATDHARFKEAYEEEFLKDWDLLHEELASELGIATWEEINYEGAGEIHGFGRTYRSGKQRGGLKILFKDSLGGKVAFIWMRGSGTEPVFRVLADAKGNDSSLERRLLDWHVSMIRRADVKIAALLSAAK